MEELEKPSRRTFQARLESMVDAIRGDIMNGVYREGDYLPSEKAFAKQYRISNKTVRQGLESLVAERLIEKIPRVGNKVLGLARDDTTVLRFGCHTSLFQEALMKTLIAEFHKQHPGIRIELFTFPSGLQTYQTVKTAIEEKRIDVFTMNYNSFDDFRLNGALDDLETLEPIPAVYPFLTESVTLEGRLKLQPFVFSPLVLCYNKDHFREKGVMEPDSSWRWNTLFEQASKLAVENERLGFYFHFPSSNRWPVFLLQSGIRFDRDPSGRSAGSAEQLKQSLRACRDLIYLQNRFPLFLSEKDGDAEELFFGEKVSMIMTTYLALNHHERRKEFEYDIAPLPYLNDPKTLLLMIGLAVNAHSERKESALRFVDFLLSYRVQLMIRQKTLSIPSLKPAAEWSGKETMYRPSRFPMYRDIIPTFRSFNALNMSSSELYRFYREAKLFWSGLETEEVAVKRLEQLLYEERAVQAGSAT
ncbi:extracellular solute-binding protein [Paenibacillus sp. GYB003]|uniref:extracellular solute-binding protein n=1 Tax=Paenibacillus sp. GYB003 TaxID=2994392 RepID=UPI002F9657C4